MTPAGRYVAGVAVVGAGGLVALAVAPDYAARLGRFLRARDSELGRLAAAVQVCAAV